MYLAKRHRECQGACLVLKQVLGTVNRVSIYAVQGIL